MRKSAKVAISLPEDILEAIEKERRARGESRSQFLRRAAESLLQQEQAHKDIERYVQSYRRMPESEEEIAAADQLGKAALGREPWE